MGEFDGRVIHTRVSFGNFGTHSAFAFSLLHAPPHFVSILGLVVGMELFSIPLTTRSLARFWWISLRDVRLVARVVETEMFTFGGYRVNT